MGSILSSTSSKGSYYYLALFVCMTIASIYMLLFQKQSVFENFRYQALQLNYVALQNGIRLANYKFIISNKKTSLTNRWIIDGTGLDYNARGYPIGTNVSTTDQEAPKNSKQCIQIWNFVLSSLRPTVNSLSNTMSSMNTEYWVTLSKENACIFRSYHVANQAIYYKANLGEVSLIEIKN